MTAITRPTKVLVLGAIALAVLVGIFLLWRPFGTSGTTEPGVPAGVEKERLRFLPATSRLIVTFDSNTVPEDSRQAWKNLGEVMYRSHLTPELKKEKIPSAIREVTSVTVAMPYVGSIPEGMIVVRGKIDGELLASHARECAKLNPQVKELPATAERPVPIFRRVSPVDGPAFPVPQALSQGLYALVGGEEVYFAVPDEETLILTIAPSGVARGAMQTASLAASLFGEKRQFFEGREEIEKAIKARRKGTENRLDPRLNKLIEAADPRAWITFAMLNAVRDPLLPPLPEIRETFKNWDVLYGGQRETRDEAELRFTARGKDIDAAKEMEVNANANIKILRSVVRDLTTDPKEKAALEAIFGSMKVSRTDLLVTVTATAEPKATRNLFGPRNAP